MDNVILYFAVKYLGDWEQIYMAISEKETINSKNLEKIKDENKNKFLTIVSENYPKEFKDIYKPPFIIFYEGNTKLLDYKNKITIIEKEIKTKDIQEFFFFSETVFIIDIQNQFLINRFLELRINFIAVSKNGINIDNDLHKKIIESKNLIISEMPDSKNIQDEIYFKRLMLGLSKQLIFFNKINSEDKDYLKLAAIDNLKIYSLKQKNAFGFNINKIEKLRTLNYICYKH